jgi:ketosteroid isomerase-like protein
MNLTRRDLAAAGALALGASTLIRPALAAPAGEAAVTQATEALRKAILGQDKAKLEALVADQVSYGHSSAVIQDKPTFVNGVMTRKATIKSLDFPELKVAIAGDAAIARHLWLSESVTDGKPTTTKIGVLAVWQKQAADWKLLARQAYKLA